MCTRQPHEVLKESVLCCANDLLLTNKFGIEDSFLADWNLHHSCLLALFRPLKSLLIGYWLEHLQASDNIDY